MLENGVLTFKCGGGVCNIGCFDIFVVDVDVDTLLFRWTTPLNLIGKKIL